MMVPESHPQRQALNDEVHARPPQGLAAPLRLSYLALFCGSTLGEEQWRPVAELAARFGIAPPAEGARHYHADFGRFELVWERHTEFSRYMFVAPGTSGDLFAEPAIAAVPGDWIASIPGQIVVAAHGVLVPDLDELRNYDAVAARFFAGNVLVGSSISGGAGAAFTDFRIQPDGFSRFLVLDRGMTLRQAGRNVQRLLEIDTYRIMAMMTLPVARALAPILTSGERELVQITTALAEAGADEPALLDRLTRLEAEIESRIADNHYRFSAAIAYHELVLRRIGELREQRIEGLQTFQEFIERRMSPAMNTCRATALRQYSLSERLARATQLLSTRVDITRERQNQSLLESMDRRAKLQLRLQETVEGLSVAAISYYIVGLVGYAVKGVKSLGIELNSDMVIGASIPVVAIAVALGMRKIRQSVTHDGTADPAD